jgi:hypothetical protein
MYPDCMDRSSNRTCFTDTTRLECELSVVVELLVGRGEEERGGTVNTSSGTHPRWRLKWGAVFRGVAAASIFTCTSFTITRRPRSPQPISIIAEACYHTILGLSANHICEGMVGVLGGKRRRLSPNTSENFQSSARLPRHSHRFKGT